MAVTGGVALITGCSSGIGRALVSAFRAHGERVVATARKPESIADLAGDGTLCVPLDVTDASSVRAAVEDAEEWGGGIDLLVNNAGYGLIGPVAELSDDELRHQLETNVVGVVRLIRAVVPIMAARRSGRIVNIGSVASLLATPFGGAYSASKASVHLLSDALRPEVAPFGIDVVVVRAGAVATRFADTADRSVDRYLEHGVLYRDYVDGIRQRAAMSRILAMPADVFARRLVAMVSRPNPPALVKLGGGARLVPALAMLPKKVLARTLGRKFGLR
jgi:NAD(P)-dependent dehydrogenase (short-subunit alcohol dehydrogenase family)